MSITAVQSKSVALTISASSPRQITSNSSVTSGNLIIVCYAEDIALASSTATISDNLGTSYTQIRYNGASNNIAYLWYGIASSSGSLTVSVTSTAGSPQLFFAEFSGCSATLETVTLSAASSGYKISTATDGDLVFTWLAGYHQLQTFSSTSTTTLQSISGSNNDSGAIGYQIATSAGVQTVDLASNGGTDNSTIIVSFKATGAPAATRGAARTAGAVTGAQTLASKINVVAGNLLVVGFGTNTAGTPSMSDSLGTTYTYLGTFTISGNHGHFWYGVPSSSGAVTFTVSSSWSFPCLSFAELINAGAVDVSSTSSAASGYTVTTTANYDLLITMVAGNHSINFSANSTSMVLASTSSSDSICMGFQDGGTAGSQTSGITGSFTDNCAFFVGFLVTVTGGGGGGGGGRILIHRGMQGGMRPLLLGGCNG